MFFYCCVVTAQDKYIIAVDDAYSFNGTASNVREFFNKVYAPLGIKPVFEFYPSLRGLKLANEGHLDAESGRTAGIGKHYTNLIKVSYPIMHYKSVYFCIAVEACKIDEATRFAVTSGFEAGKKYCIENKLNCLIDQSHGVIAKALESGTIDVLVASFNTGTEVLCTFKKKPVFYKNAEIFSVTGYHYIHKKHRALEPALATSIENLAKRSEITRLLQNSSVVNAKCLLELIEI